MDQTLKYANRAIKRLLYRTSLAGDKDPKKLRDNLIKYGLDQITDGFWIYDIKNHKEYYSPKFRHTLGFLNEEDFPDTPDAWQSQIDEVDLKRVINLFELHIQSAGDVDFVIDVSYYNKSKTQKIPLICEGSIVEWDGTTPVIMLGTHIIKKPDTFAG